VASCCQEDARFGGLLPAWKGFVACLRAVLAVPVGVRAQEACVYRIGVIHQGGPYADALNGLRTRGGSSCALPIFLAIPSGEDNLRHDPRHRTPSSAMPAATAWYFSQNERSIGPLLEAEVAAR
jgi:hypothetical protein